jgi:2-polyprenyl-6-methoxyphenol hydroxylase-like FAD-dependent oxidoreductase
MADPTARAILCSKWANSMELPDRRQHVAAGRSWTEFRMSSPASTDVLIIGAGPTGLALAGALAQQDVSCLIIDQQPSGANTSRACVVHARTLETLEPLGVVPDLLTRGLKVPIFRIRVRDRVLLTVDFRHLPSAHAYTLMLPQCDTEAALLDRLAVLGRSVLRPCALTTIQSDADGATVTLRGPNGERVVRTRYLVGCDGMHSSVRRAADIPFDGGHYQENFVLADVHMDWPLSRDEVTLFYSAAGLVVVAPIPGRRFRVVATVPHAPVVPTASDIQALLDARGPPTGRACVRDMVWGSRFHIQHRVARTFRAGPVLLAGDAAHVHSPAGGQGMNIGIRDAVSLGGALKGVFCGDGDRALIEWAERRRRIARTVVRMTDRMTGAGTVSGRIDQHLRNAALGLIGHVPAARQAIALRLSGLNDRAA